MWLLITIILFNNSTTKVEVLEVFTNKAQCISRGNYASRIGIPEGMVIQCIPLKGVKPKQIKRRASRNSARRKVLNGRKSTKDVDHKDGNPMNNSRKNLRLSPKGRNRARK